MKRTTFAWTVSLAASAAVAFVFACGGPDPKTAKTAPGGSKDPNTWPADDRSMCDWRDKPELEVNETTGPGAIRPNVRRIFKVMGEQDSRRKVLICREIDTNLDGLKDVVRTFNSKGEALHEEADTNYDGKVDLWTDFIAGRLAKEEQDTNFDGRADVWKYYSEGQLSRIRRSTHCPNGKPDIWEVYVRGHLERVGNDSSCDGHIDRWDRDTERIAQQEEEQLRAQNAVVDAGSAPMVVGSDGGISFNDSGADSAKK